MGFISFFIEFSHSVQATSPNSNNSFIFSIYIKKNNERTNDVKLLVRNSKTLKKKEVTKLFIPNKLNQLLLIINNNESLKSNYRIKFNHHQKAIK